MIDVISHIRSDAQKILESTDVVTIHEDVIATQLIPQLQAIHEHQKKLPFTIGHRSHEQDLGLVVFYNVMNFCFQDPTSQHEYAYKTKAGEQLTRSTAFFTALAEAAIDWNNLHAVTRITEDQWVHIIQLTDKNPLYLGKERRERAVGFAEFLQKKGYKTIKEFLEDKEFDTEKILLTLGDSGYFTDRFLKRAQLTVRSIDEIQQQHNKARVKDVEMLTCMADYRIPQVFYNTDVITLNPALQQRIENNELLISESPEELALRATVVVLGEKISKLLDLPEMTVDRLLWKLSQDMVKFNEMTIPHILVATDKY